MNLNSTEPRLLVDADIFVYQAISIAEREIEFEEDVWVMYTNLRDAHDALSDALNKIIDAVPDHNVVMCFSDQVNFRKELNPTYKSNRRTRKPMAFKEFRQFAINNYQSVILPTLEADDLLGILATDPKAPPSIIVSADKDLKQIPGKHLVDGEVITITKEQGDYFHMMQTLTGDAVDGYAGCPGIGPKKAETILAKATDGVSVWGAVVGAYVKAGLDEEEALLQARMARILQWGDYDMQKNKVNLWQPTIV